MCYKTCMRTSTLLAVACCLGMSSTVAQQIVPAEPTVTAFECPEYPALAASNRLQGVVKLRVTTDGHHAVDVKLLSGHPMLAPTAYHNVQTWKFADHPPTTFVVTYYFVNESSRDSDSAAKCAAKMELPTKVTVSTKLGGPQSERTNAPASWKEYTYPADNFAVSLPAAPNPHKDAQFPDVNMTVYTSGGVTLRAEDAPHGCDSAISDQLKMLEEFKSGRSRPSVAQPQFQLNLSSVRQGSVEGRPFLEFEQTVQASTNDYERWYCVGRKLYVFSAAWPVGQARPESLERIVRSFRLLNK